MTPVTVDDDLLDRARAGDEDAFRALTDPYRRELQVHCYRILGSLQDAEDLVQETLLAAWQGLPGFEGRASLRAWLYRIATNRCLNALRDRGRRPSTLLPGPTAPPEPTRWAEPTWLEPYPDALLEGLPDQGAGPEARYEQKEAVSLAFVGGLQRLAPAQRAALVLRDVLGFRAAEAAEMLDTTEASVNSALQRARATVEAATPPREDRPLPGSPRERAVAERFAEAFSIGDVDRVVALLTEDAWVTMPPQPHQYQGRAAAAAFFRSRPIWDDGPLALRPTRANGAPAFGYYIGRPARLHGIVTMRIEGEEIAELTRFGIGRLGEAFGLPETV
jgi:RNA polymerase sigma-70 factor (ECF subfamily)